MIPTCPTIRPQRHRVAFALVLTLVLSAVALAGCSVDLIAQYDEETVKSATELLKKIDAFLIKMERLLDTPGAHEELKYENHTAFYDEIKLDLILMRVRAAAIPKNELTAKQIDALAAGVKALEEEDGRGFNKRVVVTARGIINQAIQAILD